MTEGMLSLFAPDATVEEIRFVMKQMVSDGRLVAIGERDGEVVYVLTDAGLERSSEILDQLEVTVEEADAWVGERVEMPRLGITASDVAGVRP